MSWLVGSTLASIVVAFVVIRIFDYAFSGIAGRFADMARVGIFVSTWVAVTVGAGMRSFTSRVRALRQRNKEVISQIDRLAKDMRH